MKLGLKSNGSLSTIYFEIQPNRDRLFCHLRVHVKVSFSAVLMWSKALLIKLLHPKD
jgi:hypothetical protein